MSRVTISPQGLQDEPWPPPPQPGRLELSVWPDASGGILARLARFWRRHRWRDCEFREPYELGVLKVYHCRWCGQPVETAHPPIHRRCVASPWWLAPKNWVVAMFRWAGSGFRLASRRVQRQRLLQCAACPLNRDGVCAVCRCPVALKVKLASEACPDPAGARWSAVKGWLARRWLPEKR